LLYTLTGAYFTLGIVNMSLEINSLYEEIISCEANEEEGLIHIKIVALPYINSVEFNIEEARQLSEKLNLAIKKIEGFYK
jgi:hypothetical protein